MHEFVCVAATATAAAVAIPVLVSSVKEQESRFSVIFNQILNTMLHGAIIKLFFQFSHEIHYTNHYALDLNQVKPIRVESMVHENVLSFKCTS